MTINWILNKTFSFALMLFLLGTATATYADLQEPQARQPEIRRGRPFQDPIRQLNLTPEQASEIRTIRESLREERAEAGRRVRETRRALDEALESDAPDEGAVEDLLRQAAEAQAAEIRLRVLTEVRIRKILSAEQRATLRTMRRQARRFRREQFPANPPVQPREGLSNPRRQPNRNGLAPERPADQRQPSVPRP
ncbi:MAG TPA: Spy/CpxP family protein refolding chaperone [Pyrinomonadaceae bacterium]|nr:Spy/CpxP family protein refolding chaperone [Pyrinomonadaceae bacterium]